MICVEVIDSALEMTVASRVQIHIKFYKFNSVLGIRCRISTSRIELS